MHIAFYTNTYHPVVNGVVRSVHSFRKALIDLGHNVFIFAQEAKGYEDSEPFIFRYPSISLPTQQNYPLTIPISSHVDWLLPSLKLDVIHSHDPFLMGNAAASKSEELGVPLVFTHHTRYRAYGSKVPLNQKLVRNTIENRLDDYMSQCHHIIAPSESAKLMLQEEYGVASQITALPTGLDLSCYKTPDRQAMRRARGWGQELVLISVGRLAKEKNWEPLLKAAARIIHHYAAVRLVLIGDGDDRRRLQRLTRTLGIAGRVEFTGTIPHGDVIRYLKAADIFCFASVTETQGLVTMEAMAAGLPVVAVDSMGTSDVVKNDQEGLLTDNDSQALAGALEKVINDIALRERFREAAQKRAETLSIAAQGQKLVTVYEQALEDQRAGHFVQVSRNNLPELKRKRWYRAIDNLIDPVR